MRFDEVRLKLSQKTRTKGYGGIIGVYKSNAIVEHCNFRNNGDDAQAIWSAEGLECTNNTFRYNTVEYGWHAAGAAVYGGKDNKFYSIIIKDNLEAGLRANNFFPGVSFNDSGTHEFSDITLFGCGTFNDLWNDQIGAIDISCSNLAGTRVQNVRFSKIDILDSKNDAIYIYKWAGDGIVRMKSESVKTDYIHVEKLQNQAWYGIVEPSWWSALWIHEPVIIPTSITKISFEKTADIYPNPSNGEFTLSMDNFAAHELRSRCEREFKLLQN